MILFRYLFFIIVCISSLSYAGDRNFNYVYQSSVMSKGSKEIEIWTTARLGRNVPYYAALDHRIEFEAGLSNKLQTAFYINFSHISSDNGNGMVNTFNFKGVSSEWKYQFSNPYTNAIGFALYSEIGLTTDLVELETKLIFDKKIKKTTIALNMSLEHEWELSSGKPVKELSQENSFGLCYFVSPLLKIGFEMRNQNEFENGDEGFELENSTLFAGPVISYVQSTWWANLTVLPQVAAFKGKTPGSNLQLSEHEKLETRLIFSFKL